MGSCFARSDGFSGTTPLPWLINTPLPTIAPPVVTGDVDRLAGAVLPLGRGATGAGGRSDYQRMRMAWLRVMPAPQI
jgi:hypothetical protein